MNNIILGTQLAFDELTEEALALGTAVFYLPLTKEDGLPCEFEKAGYLKAYIFHKGRRDFSKASEAVKEHADMEWFHFGVCYYNGAFSTAIRALKNIGGVFTYTTPGRCMRFKFLDINYIMKEE